MSSPLDYYKMKFRELECMDDSLSSTDAADTLKRKLEDQDLPDPQETLKNFESIIFSMEPDEKKICISLQQTLEELLKDKENSKKKIIELISKLKHERNVVLDGKFSAVEMENQLKAKHFHLQLELQVLEERLKSMKVKFVELKNAKAETEVKLNNEMYRMELKLSAVAKDSQLSKYSFMTLKRKFKVEQTAKDGTFQEELGKKDEIIKNLENKLVEAEQSAVAAESMEVELVNFKELKKENQLLKEQLKKKDNNLLLFQRKQLEFQEKIEMSKKMAWEKVKMNIKKEMKSKTAPCNVEFPEMSNRDNNLLFQEAQLAFQEKIHQSEQKAWQKVKMDMKKEMKSKTAPYEKSSQMSKK